ncbi:helix-turn-helix protein [Pseudaminobacter salicylatoxidans]|uniref:Helix-turn-helix protein n=1 Tax=Pseudaminobacter salicylatoxidans TaxID=93369 RepID=A0A316CNM6_PSESE|nr:helix-turn-helix transcriptional regulator [Pseudaminobacter salicylatoxidans]PWJ83754.1 helix-turn-helix protein [Pseudaminobacter salicylatoxidans]
MSQNENRYNIGNYPITESNILSTRTLARTRSDLSDFLIRHRAKLTPADVGLPTTGGRRTPGLRREEVAGLAGVGLTWYTWFEQGRDIQVSESFLLKVAKALRLDDSECSRLFLFAHRRPPPPEAYQWPSVKPLIQQMLDDLTVRPAYVLNLRWDVIAWNVAADDLFSFARREQVDRNVMRIVFADPDMRHRLPAWKEDAPRLLAQFRADLTTAPDDPAMLALIDELKILSPDFRRWFEQPEMESYSRGIGALLDHAGVRCDFAHEMLIVDEYRHLKMIVYFGSSDRRLIAG